MGLASNITRCSRAAAEFVLTNRRPASPWNREHVRSGKREAVLRMAAQVFTAVRHINVRMISQGASEINMSFMIDEEDADEAVRSLHAAFFQNPDPAIFDVEARKQIPVVSGQ